MKSEVNKVESTGRKSKKRKRKTNKVGVSKKGKVTCLICYLAQSIRYIR